MGTKIKSDFLISSPSWASGAARLLDWGNTFDAYNFAPSEEEADTTALTADWKSVGDDLFYAMTAFAESYSEK